MQYQIIRLALVAKMLGLSRATIWRRLSDDPTFPKPLRLKPGNSKGAAIGFIQSEIEDWVKASAQQRPHNISKGK